MLDQGIDHAREKRARVHDDLLLAVCPLGNLSHVSLELRGHVGARDVRRVGGERLDDGHAKLAWLHGIALEVLDVKEALDDRGASRLGPEAVLLHLLDEPPLAVAGGRLGLLGVELHRVDVTVIPHSERWQDLVLLLAKGIDGPEALLHDNDA